MPTSFAPAWGSVGKTFRGTNIRDYKSLFTAKRQPLKPRKLSEFHGERPGDGIDRGFHHLHRGRLIVAAFQWIFVTQRDCWSHATAINRHLQGNSDCDSNGLVRHYSGGKRYHLRRSDHDAPIAELLSFNGSSSNELR